MLDFLLAFILLALGHTYFWELFSNIYRFLKGHEGLEIGQLQLVSSSNPPNSIGVEWIA